VVVVVVVVVVSSGRRANTTREERGRGRETTGRGETTIVGMGGKMAMYRLVFWEWAGRKNLERHSAGEDNGNTRKNSRYFLDSCANALFSNETSIEELSSPYYRNYRYL